MCVCVCVCVCVYTFKSLGIGKHFLCFWKSLMLTKAAFI